MDITWPSLFALSLPLAVCLAGALIVLLFIADPSKRQVVLTAVCLPVLVVAVLAPLALLAAYHFRGVKAEQRALISERQYSLKERLAGVVEIKDARDPSADRETDALDETNEQASDARLTASIVTPSGRPEWVETPPKRIGEPHTAAVASGLYTTFEECQGALTNQIEEATTEYVDWYFESTGRGSRRDLVYCPAVATDLSSGPNVHRESIEFDFASMRQIHVLLEFDDEYRRRLDQSWNDTEIARRLTHVGFLALGALSLLSTLYIYLKLDDATNGRCAGRLQFVASGVILALVGSGVLLARWIPWM